MQRLLIPIVLTSLCISTSFAVAADERPNIVVVLLDDLGFSDLGCYGGEIDTPHMNELAASGLRFTQFYNCARCCPTRAALMTGLYPHQVGLERNGQSLTRDGVTIAEALQGAGYQTAMAGKWHLSETFVLRPPQRHMHWLNHQLDPPNQSFGPLDSYPMRRGFGQFYGIIWGVVDYFDPFSLVDGMKPVGQVPDDYYITDAITTHAVRYVREADPDKPLFLYVAHCAPHWPLHARKEDIAKYRNRFADGWHAMRQRRYRKQVEMGLIDPKTHPLPELMGRGKDWDQLSTAERAIAAAKMQVHAAMVDRVDQGVGQLVQALKDSGRYENTALFVLADNGASPEAYPNPGYDRSSQTREGAPIRYSGFAPEEIGSETTYTGIGPYWANAANTPFRFWKKESFEGGLHTPLIVHWPKGLNAAPGSTTDQTGHVIDVLPTCLELAGVDYPREYQGHMIQPLEGRSLGPILRGEKREGHAALYFEHEGGKAVLADGWKLVQPSSRDVWELYHLAQDRTETRNLATVHPGRVERMNRMWAEWADRVGVRKR